MTALKVFTLNCWALPFPVICKNRPERMEAIGNYLHKEDFDIAVLEEIWVKSDFHKLRQKFRKTYPFSHYFYSGTIGSGVCVFSKHVITETCYMRYHLNGHAHKIFHGDWFGGKGVGLCKLEVEDFKVNLYCTHFHAEYNPAQDEYAAHRMAQAYEMSHFVRLTSGDCDLVVAAGDFNIAPTSIGYRIITQNAGLSDCWVERQNEVDNEDGASCDVPGNSYTSSATSDRLPNGERIDYVLFKPQGCHVEVKECRVGGLGKIPDHNVSYSDHEPVRATMALHKAKPTEAESPGASKDLKDTLQDFLMILDRGVSQCLSDEKFFQLMVVVLAVLLYMLTSHVDVTGTGVLVPCGTAAFRLALAIALGFCVWIALIVKRAEFHGLVACKEDIMKQLGVL